MAVVLTKSDEIGLFASIVAGCPEGYVRDILDGIKPDVENAIRNDYGSITVGLGREISDLHAERDRLSSEVEAIKANLDAVRARLQEARRTISQGEALAATLRQTVASIRSL